MMIVLVGHEVTPIVSQLRAEHHQHG
jgi:hypothetical protein